MSDLTSDTDLELVHQALRETQDNSSQNTVSYFDPAKEIENSLISLLHHRISKLENDERFEEAIKENLLARLPEASISELLRALESAQVAANVSVEKILAPFTSKGDRVPLLENDRIKKRVDEDVLSKAPKEVIAALSELGRVLQISKKIKTEKET
jgi:hypothetical protein